MPAPAAVDLVPLVVPVGALDFVFDRWPRDLLARGIDRHDVELRLATLARIAAFEGRADAEIDVAGAHRQRRVLDVAAPFEARLARGVGLRCLEREERRLERLAVGFGAEVVAAE